MTLRAGDRCISHSPAGPSCPRLAEVTVAFVTMSTGQTTRRESMCPVHAYAALGRAFIDVARPGRELMTVIVAPL